MIEGVDVSSWQSEAYEIKGQDFVFVKLSESTNYVNPKWPKQVERARTAGAVVGHYIYAQNGSAAEVDFFIRQLKPKIKTGELIAYDWEDADVSNAEKDARIKQLKAAFPGHKVGLYCNRNYWLNIDKTSEDGDFLWIADPTTKGKPRIQAKWVFHQYSTAGGIDHNVANFADKAALRKWAGYATTPPAAPANPTTPTPKTYDASKVKVGDSIRIGNVTAKVTKIG